MSGTKRHYRPNATKTVSVKAAPWQVISWSDAARRWGKGTPGAFLAWAGDMAVAALNAFDSVKHPGHCGAVCPLEAGRRR
jgi:hypothetical protein